MTRVLVDRYELGEQLGAGGMARVVAARDRLLEREVAVKLLREEIASSGQDRFLREARTAASFTHPHAVAVYDTGRDGDTPFIVMELVDGPTLAEVLAERGRLSPDEAVAVMSQVLAALAAAHRRGLVHRDIKPGNILLPGGHVPRRRDEEPGAKLTDFGIAKGIEEVGSALTVTGQVLGTPRYVSPEQVSGHPATPRSDVYSAGVVLYELLTGAAPFSGDNPIAVALAHREDPVPRLDRRRKDLDRRLVATVHVALEKDPEKRFAEAGAMRAALLDPHTAPPLPAAASAVAAAPASGGAAPTQPVEGTRTAVLEPEVEEDEPGQGRRRAPIIVALLLLAGLLAALWFGWQFLDVLEPPAVETEEPDEPVDEPAEEPADPADEPADDPADTPDDDEADEPEETDEDAPPGEAEGPPDDVPGEGPDGAENDEDDEQATSNPSGDGDDADEDGGDAEPQSEQSVRQAPSTQRWSSATSRSAAV